MNASRGIHISGSLSRVMSRVTLCVARAIIGTSSANSARETGTERYYNGETEKPPCLGGGGRLFGFSCYFLPLPGGIRFFELGGGGTRPLPALPPVGLDLPGAGALSDAQNSHHFFFLSATLTSPNSLALLDVRNDRLRLEDDLVVLCADVGALDLLREPSDVVSRS